MIEEKSQFPAQSGTQANQVISPPLDTKLTNIATDVFSGIRPSGNLTVANYVGAVSQFINLQERGLHPLVFVADLHLLTDKEPSESIRYNREIVLDYLGCGLDPKKCNIFLQSDIKEEVFAMTAMLMRHISIAELLRLPTLKDKVKDSEHPEQANSLLVIYPVMMAADILLQRPRYVPVGEDQLPHIEITRKVARRFNTTYGETLPIPEVQENTPIRILGLKGSGKMGKSNPEEAIFLSDTPDVITKKIKGAKTAVAGELNDGLLSNINLAKGLANSPQVIMNIEDIVERHLSGQQVMGDFKKLLTEITTSFVSNFQERRNSYENQPRIVDQILEEGRALAKQNAQETLQLTYEAMGLKA